MIRCEHVLKKYQSEPFAIQDVTFEVLPGEIVGIVGESGSGKSTLLKLLNGMLVPDSGIVELFGINTKSATKSQRQLIKNQTGMIFQHYNLLHNLTVLDNVLLPLTLLKRKDKEKAIELLEMVGLKDKLHDYPSQLSGGQKQRVAIARALIREPKVLLLDEATSALDEGTTYELLDQLKRIHAQLKPTIIFVSHELESVKYLCDRSLVLDKGQLIADVAISQVSSEQREMSYKEKAVRSLTS